MALVRLDIPGLILYGGSIAPGQWEGHDVTIQDVFKVVGSHAAVKITDAQLCALEDCACPGPGACGGQLTVNRMSTVCKLLGVSPMSANAVPAMDPLKDDVAHRAGDIVMRLVADDLRPRQIVTCEALENAIASVALTGGSTNAVLHLLAIAREAGASRSISMTSTGSTRRCRCSPTSNPVGGSWRSIYTRAEASRLSRTGSASWGCSTGLP